MLVGGGRTAAVGHWRITGVGVGRGGWPHPPGVRNDHARRARCPR